MVRSLVLVCLLAGSAAAQGVGIPSSTWGIGFGNSPQFSGLRFNFRDENVKRVNGLNFTLWRPEDHNQDAVITGISLGLIPGGGVLHGLQLGVFGVIGMKSVYGISFATLGMGAGEDLVGINVAGLGMGAGKRIIGLNVATLGMGAGEDLLGINIGGLGVGAGHDVAGLNFAGLGLGAGRRLTGINLAGLALGVGETVTGFNVAILGLGAPTVRGLSIAGVVGGETLEGVHVGLLSVHAIRNGQMYGLAISPFNYIKGRQTGVAIGVVNYAWSVRGVQLGVVNIVRDNPTPLKVLPVFNSSF